MTLTHARALIPDLSTAPSDPEADRVALGRLADWCGRYSPSTGGDDSSGISGDHGLWIDVTGCAHLFGGEQALLADLDRRLTRLGIDHRLGMAPNLGAAWAIARFRSETPIVPSGDLCQAVRELPVAGLRLLPETVTLLRRLGLTRIGQLEALPRIALARRFTSPEISHAVLQRLDQLLDRQEEPLSPERPLPVYRTTERFLEPVDQVPAVAHALSVLAERLCQMLDRAGQGALRVGLFAYRVDGDVRRLQVGTSQPTHDRRHIERLFAERIETIDAGFGIEQLALHAEEVVARDKRQVTLDPGSGQVGAADDPIAQLIDRIANRLGPEAVTVSVPVASYVPERAEQHVTALTSLKDRHRVDWQNRLAGPLRPASLLPRPEPITAIAAVPDGPPMTFTWRRVVRRIVRAEGPERIAPEWWDHAAVEVDSIGIRGTGAVRETNIVSGTGKVRDYYRVEDEQGRRYWLFRAGLYDDTGKGTPSWFIHGLFG